MRLAALYSYDVIDSEREDAFDDLTKLAAHICQAPIAAISLTEDTREWFKSTLGMDLTEAPIDHAFSAHAILDPSVPLIVPDTLQDPRFQDNALVHGTPGIRFYAGIPLIDGSGFALGTLSVIDVEPRTIAPEQVEMLRSLARQAVAQIQLRKANRSLRKQAHALESVREDALRTVRRTLSLLRSTSNELNTTLHEAAAEAVALAATGLTPDQRKRADLLQAALDEGTRSLGLVADLVDLESTAPERPTTPVQAAALLRQVLREFGAGGARVELDGLDEKTLVPLEAFSFSTLCRSLCLGLPGAKDSEVQLSLTDGGQWLRLRWESPNPLASDFAIEPFGIQIARRVTELLEGRFVSETSVSRVLIHVDLPAKTRGAAPGIETQEPERRRGARVLVVEDNQVNVMVIQAMLEERGYSVDCVDSGEDAVQRVRANEYDLVLMDVQMPGLDGLEATRKIRALGGKYASLPIVAITANASEDDRAQCLAAGMNDYISKPYKPATLTETLQRWGLSRT
jgi:CheY-like chemotaxis protein/GAF domain-containing protein